MHKTHLLEDEKSREPQSATLGAVNVTVENTQAYFLAAKYMFGDATVKGGWERYALKAASDDYTAATIGNYYGYPVGTVTANGWTSGSQNGVPDKTTNVCFVGGDYNFTSALNFAAGYYWVVNEAYGANSLGVGATASSNINAFSALLDYHFSKRTDVYGGFMHLNYGGSYQSAGTYNTSNYIAGIGLRAKF